MEMLGEADMCIDGEGKDAVGDRYESLQVGEELVLGRTYRIRTRRSCHSRWKPFRSWLRLRDASFLVVCWWFGSRG